MLWFNKRKEKDVPETPIPVEPEVIEKKLKSFIGRRSKLAASMEITQDTKLFSSGLLDSLTFIQMVTFIESEFKIRLLDVVGVNLSAMDNLAQVIKVVQQALAKGK